MWRERMLGSGRQESSEVSMLKLFYAPHTCALASHIALEEAGAGYEAVRVDFKKNAQRAPDYLAVNCKGRVPSLATDLGILTKARRSWPSSLRATPSAVGATRGLVCVRAGA